MKRVLLKTFLLLGLPSFIGYLTSYFLRSQTYLIFGILIGVISFIWIAVNKIRHFGRAIKYKEADSLGLPRE